MTFDIAGMLTGVSNQAVNPNLSVQQQQLAMGANATRMMQGGMESLRRSAGGAAPIAEQLQMAMSQLDLEDPADLTKLAKLQQATGNLAGAAKTAASVRKIQAARASQVGGKTAMLALLIKNGLGDSVEFEEVKSGVYDNLTATQFQSIIDLAKKAQVQADVSGTNFSLYEVPFTNPDTGVVTRSKQQVGKIEIDAGSKGKQTVWGYISNGGEVIPVDFNSITKVDNKDAKGISIQGGTVTNIQKRLTTAASSGAKDRDKQLLEGWGWTGKTNADDAWTALDEDTKYQISLAVATRSEMLRTRKTNPLNQLEAENKAIKEIFTDNVKEREWSIMGTLNPFNWADTVLDMDKTQEEIAKGLVEKQAPSGTFQVKSNNNLPVIFNVEPEKR